MAYGFKVEIWGDYACFSRPELKVERVSYEIITPSAVRGILEAVFWKPAIKYIIDQIDVCETIKFENIRRNELNSKIPYLSIETAEEKLLAGKLEISSQEDRAQRAAQVLKNVRYVVNFHFEMTDKAGPEDNEEKFYAILSRRLRNGQNYHTPYLGTREFPAKVKIIEDKDSSPAPIRETKSFGLVLYDIDYEVKTDEKGNYKGMDFNPTYFMANMINGVIDLRNIEVLK